MASTAEMLLQEGMGLVFLSTKNVLTAIWPEMVSFAGGLLVRFFAIHQVVFAFF